jgi:DNA-binding beta-propeller fold protein YncE
VGLNNHQVVASVGTGFHDQEAIATVRNGTKAYIGTFDRPYVTVMGAVRQAVIGRVQVGLGATSIAVAHPRFGERAYVALLTAKKLAVIRTSDAVVVADVKFPHGPQTVTTTPGSQNEWVGSSFDGTIWVVSTTNPKIRRTISVPQAGPVVSIAFSPNGRYAWVSGLGGVAVVSRASGKTVKFLPITRIFPNNPNLNMGPVKLNRTGTIALVVNSTFPDNPQPGSVRVIKTKTYKLGENIPMGTEPIGLAIDQVRNTAYVTNFADDTVTYFQVPKG